MNKQESNTGSSKYHAPTGTLFLLLLFALAMIGGWLGMYFYMFLAHGPVS